MTPVWQLKGLTRRFRTGPWWARQVAAAVNDVSLVIQAGERVGIIGESGAGKSTLARAGLGLIPANSGQIELFGEPTARWGSRQWREVRSQVQMLFQDPRAMLNPHLPIGWVLEESAEIHGRERSPGEEARAALKAVGLAGRYWAMPHELSGGELRRAGIARLLLARPRLVVADEPTAGLDAPLKAALLELLLMRLGTECALVLISHDLPLVQWATDRVLVMRGGQIVDRFDTSQVMPDDRHPYTRELLRASGWTC